MHIVRTMILTLICCVSWAGLASAQSASLKTEPLPHDFLQHFYDVEEAYGEVEALADDVTTTKDPRCQRVDKTVRLTLQRALWQLEAVIAIVAERPYYPAETDQKKLAAIQTVEQTYASRIDSLKSRIERLPEQDGMKCQIEATDDDLAL